MEERWSTCKGIAQKSLEIIIPNLRDSQTSTNTWRSYGEKLQGAKGDHDQECQGRNTKGFMFPINW